MRTLRGNKVSAFCTLRRGNQNGKKARPPKPGPRRLRASAHGPAAKDAGGTDSRALRGQRRPTAWQPPPKTRARACGEETLTLSRAPPRVAPLAEPDRVLARCDVRCSDDAVALAEGPAPKPRQRPHRAPPSRRCRRAVVLWNHDGCAEKRHNPSLAADPRAEPRRADQLETTRRPPQCAHLAARSWRHRCVRGPSNMMTPRGESANVSDACAPMGPSASPPCHILEVCALARSEKAEAAAWPRQTHACCASQFGN